MGRKIGRFDKHFRPHPSHEFLLAEQLAMVFDQCDQDIERSAAESERLSSFKRQPLPRTDGFSCLQPLRGELRNHPASNRIVPANKRSIPAKKITDRENLGDFS
jgi:hypothetical protein